MDRDGYPIKPIPIDWEDEKTETHRLRLQIRPQHIANTIRRLPPRIAGALLTMTIGVGFVCQYTLKLDEGLLFGMILISCGFACLIYVTYNHAARAVETNGLMHYAPPILSTVFQQTSIIDMFESLRNYRGLEGMPDYVFSQILPLSEHERQQVWDSLPDQTQRFIERRDVLMYPLPTRIRSAFLPAHRRPGIPTSSNANANSNSATVSSASPRRSITYPNLMAHSSSSPNGNGNLNLNFNPNPIHDGWSSPRVAGRPLTRINIESVPNDASSNEEEEPGSPRISQPGMRTSELSRDALDDGEVPVQYNPEEKMDEIESDVDRFSSPRFHLETPRSTQRPEVMTRFRGQVEAFWPVVRSSYQKFIGTDQGSRSLRWNPVFSRVLDSRMMHLITSITKFFFSKRLQNVSDNSLRVAMFASVTLITLQMGRSRSVRRAALYAWKVSVVMALCVVFLVCFVELNLRGKAQERNLFASLLHFIKRVLKVLYHRVVGTPMTNALEASRDSSDENDDDSTGHSYSPGLLGDFLE